MIACKQYIIVIGLHVNSILFFVIWLHVNSILLISDCMWTVYYCNFIACKQFIIVIWLHVNSVLIKSDYMKTVHNGSSSALSLIETYSIRNGVSIQHLTVKQEYSGLTRNPLSPFYVYFVILYCLMLIYIPSKKSQFSNTLSLLCYNRIYGMKCDFNIWNWWVYILFYSTPLFSKLHKNSKSVVVIWHMQP